MSRLSAIDALFSKKEIIQSEPVKQVEEIKPIKDERVSCPRCKQFYESNSIADRIEHKCKIVEEKPKEETKEQNGKTVCPFCKKSYKLIEKHINNCKMKVVRPKQKLNLDI